MSEKTKKPIKRITKIKNKNVWSFKAAEVREPLVQDYADGERISGASQGYRFVTAVISVCCTFDGKEPVFEDLLTMSSADFLELSEATGFSERKSPLKGSSTSSDTENSATKE